MTIKRADKEPRNNIGASARGPAIEPNPAKSMKSPPPIPSFLVINLYIKFTVQRLKKPAEYPSIEREALPRFKTSMSLMKPSNTLLVVTPKIPKKIFKPIGR